MTDSIESRRLEPMSTDPKLQQQCAGFLYLEAEILDSRALDEWLDLLADDFTYHVPRRITQEVNADQPEFSDTAYHFRDDKGTLKKRVERFEKEYAWSENPPSRTRRHVSNVRVYEQPDGNLKVKSSLLLVRSQGDTKEMDILSGERHDTLTREGGGMKMAHRTVYLDHTVLNTRSLSIFL